ncbi:MAG: ABC transporter ATP-binding protein [Agathobacter sp.]|nr:ABC transporter ATP-binding protein [Agathobacter sp.]
MGKVIEIENLTKNYGKNRGINDVSFSIEEGDIFGFLGPNGAGKSTTIRTLLGLIKKDAGKARIFGREIGSNKDFEYILKDVGYMPSEAMFYPEMKVSDTIKFAANVRRKDCDDEARMLCEKLQLDVNKKIEELSLGNRKKVSIVCAMQHKPKLFVFDEPTSGLDPLMQAEFFELINEYVKNGATCMLSTHVLSEVKNYCKHVGIMKEGKLLKVDEVSNITKTNAKKIKIVRNGKLQEFIYKGDIKEIYKEIQGDDIDDVLIEDPSLDEIFMHYYQ